MPLSFHPAFIGKLIEMQPAYRGNHPIEKRLWTAVKQCRKYNEAPPSLRDSMWPLMVRTQQELAALGVVVG